MISGAVLAGGRSLRLGTDKALLRLGGETLLERAVRVVAVVADEVLVVGRAGDALVPAGARAIPDARPGCGSLGGIYSALQAARHSHCLVVACDMPFLHEGLLRCIARLAPAYDVVIPLVKGTYETLHAAYSQACVGPIEALLAQGDLRIISFFPHVRVRCLTQAEVERFDPQCRSFFNINYPEELRWAQEFLEEARAD